jgi:hypothetical protein
MSSRAAMPRLSLVHGMFAIFVPAAAGLASCSPCQCANDCVRQYELRAQEGLGSVQFDNVSESANECDLDRVPRAIPDGERTFVGRVVAVQPIGPNAQSYRLFLEQHFETADAQAACAGLMIFGSVGALTAATLPPGTELCVVGRVQTESLCTQKGCST